MSVRRTAAAAVLVLILVAFLASCQAKDDNEVTPVDIPAESMPYIVLAWNDLGIHEINATYDAEVFLPPYNTLWAQVVRRGDPPQVVTTGVTLEYRLVDNTSSYGKTTADPVRNFTGFWDDSFDLFGVALANDTGLNLVDPGVHNGLTGTMLLKGDHFQADGIPVVPLKDDLTWDPYQVAEITVRDSSSGDVLARTRATVPVSDEWGCATCHNGDDAESVLATHDEAEETTFVDDGVPVLCADCHGDPALGQTGEGTSGRYLSKAIHGAHATQSGITCYSCHPGTETAFHRSTAHSDDDGNCTNCHGSISTLTTMIYAGRVPWVGLPACVNCHTFVAEVDTGDTLYRNATGHGGLACPACHGSPHAQVPSSEESDHYMFLQYQDKALPLGSCQVCHRTSKGGGINGIVDAHGGAQPTSCRVCHTGPITTNNPSQYPHKFQGRTR